jgi:AhpD family alkylhydroperoxidase
MATKKALVRSTLGKQLIELVNLRISQINGCAFCLEMHTRLLREAGFPLDKLDSLAGWHVSPLYDARERAALGWAEAVTDIAHTHAPDDAYDSLRAQFSDAEITDLTFAVALMNALNRMAISMRQ